VVVAEEDDEDAADGAHTISADNGPDRA